MLGRNLASHADGAVGTFAGIGVENVRAVGAQNLLSFSRNILRHAQRDRKSFGRAEHGIGNSGVAAGGVEQSLAGTELTAAAAFGNNVGRGAIFHRAAGVVPFGLA